MSQRRNRRRNWGERARTYLSEDRGSRGAREAMRSGWQGWGTCAQERSVYRWHGGAANALCRWLGCASRTCPRTGRGGRRASFGGSAWRGATSVGMDGDRRVRTAGADERQLSGRGRARRSSARAGRRASAASGGVDGRRRRPVREEARRRGRVGPATPTGRTAREASGGRAGARKESCRAARLTHGSDGGERRWRASPKEDGGGRRRRSCGIGVGEDSNEP